MKSGNAKYSKRICIHEDWKEEQVCKAWWNLKKGNAKEKLEIPWRFENTLWRRWFQMKKDGNIQPSKEIDVGKPFFDFNTESSSNEELCDLGASKNKQIRRNNSWSGGVCLNSLPEKKVRFDMTRDEKVIDDECEDLEDILPSEEKTLGESVQELLLQGVSGLANWWQTTTEDLGVDEDWIGVNNWRSLESQWSTSD